MGQTLKRTEFYSELELEGFKVSSILLIVLLNLTKHIFFKFQALSKAFANIEVI